MFKILILSCCTWALAASQGQFDYFYDYDAPVEAPQPVASRPPPPQAFQPQTRSQAPRSRPQASRPPPPQQSSRPRVDPLDADLTTPVPIVKDSRRIDTKTGAFVYEYAGADGSAKHEYRYPNGTVVGNYTFINDLGERETRFYSAGVHDPTLVDETTDPNYVDLGNYDLYKHLEQPYIHIDGSGSEGAPIRPRPQQAARPRAQSSKPRQRPSASRPVAARPPPPPPRAQIPLDYDDSALFQQAPASGPVFDYEDVGATFQDAGPPAAAPVPVAPPVPVAAPVPVAPPSHFIPSSSSRGRQGGRPRAQAPSRDPPHRLDFTGQLDSIINRFN